MSEPDPLRVEPAHARLAFRARLVQLATPNRDVAANDKRALLVLVARIG